MIVETRIKLIEQKMEQGFAEMRKLIMGKSVIGTWVMQDTACAMLNVRVRHLQNLRIHSDKNGKVVGCIRWRKGKGRKQNQYHRDDIQKYLNQVTVG